MLLRATISVQKRSIRSKIQKIRLDCCALVDVLEPTRHYRKADRIDFWKRRPRRRVGWRGRGPWLRYLQMLEQCFAVLSLMKSCRTASKDAVCGSSYDSSFRTCPAASLIFFIYGSIGLASMPLLISSVAANPNQLDK